MSNSSPTLSSFLRHKPRAIPILEIVEEAPNIKSFVFRDDLSALAKPGQFGMIWVPGVDEIPMSLLPSEHDSNVKITVKERGDGSRALLRKTRGDLIGIRGPYGKGFGYMHERRALMVGGGTGTVPLVGLLRLMASKGDTQCSFVLGARRSRELLFVNEIKDLSTRSGGIISVTTDDGSSGVKGLAADEAGRLIRSGSFDRIYTCGPELMMKKVIDVAAEVHVPAEAGMERIFKCGSGICGSCCIGPYLLCTDGPVLNSNILKELPEFGKSARDASGRPVSIGIV